VRQIDRTSALVALVLVLSLRPVYAPSAGAAGEPLILADLEGRPIPAVEVGRYHCEDFDFPRIHCYPSAAELERVVARRLASPPPSDPEPLATSGTLDDVRVAGFHAMQIAWKPALRVDRPGPSSGHADLRAIGWNDRISPFQGLAGSGGAFFEHIYTLVYPWGHWYPWLDMTVTASGGLSGSGGGT